MTPDLARLRELAPKQPQLLNLLQAMAATRLRRRHSRLKTISSALGISRGQPGAYQEMLSTLRALESCQFLRLNRASSRVQGNVEWAVHPATIRILLNEPHTALLQHHLLSPQNTLAAAGPAAPSIPAGWQRHTLMLAPGREIAFVLPADLRASEARRLGLFLQAVAPIE